MTFLNSALLIGLAVFALPLLIHLFSRRKFPLIDFSTLRFLKRLQRQQMRRLKLRQWLLLLLRVLAALLIALAFTRPALLGGVGFGGLATGRISLAIVLDASGSMQAQNRSGSNFELAQSAAHTIIKMQNPGDRALLLAARSEPLLLTPEATGDSLLLHRAIERAAVWDGTASLSQAVAYASDHLLREPDLRSEIFIISDFAEQPPLLAPPPQIHPFFVKITQETAENVAITKVELVSEIIEPGQPVEVAVALQNFGARERRDVYYSLYLNGDRVAEDVVTLAGGAQLEQRHQILPQQTGLQEGLVKIETPDVLPLDDRRYFSFSVPERLNVLLVSQPGAAGEIKLALTAVQPPTQQQLATASESLPAGRAEAQLPVRTRFAVSEATPQNWDAQALGNYDVIILSSPPTISEAQAVRVQQFVEQGGGLLLLPGAATDVALLNRQLSARLGISQWGEKIGGAAARDAFLGWQELDLVQPLLRGMFRPGSKPASPHFYQALSLLGEPDEVPIRFSNGQPFLADHVRGRGRAMICASTSQSDWSDWAFYGIFAPLLHRIMLRLGGNFAERCQTLMVGEDLEIQLSGAASGANPTALLATPDRQELKLPPQVAGQRVVYRQSRIEPAGLFRLQSAAAPYWIAVNYPAGESDLKTVELKSVYPDWWAAGAKLTTPENLVSDLRAARYGREFWKWGLILGMVVLVIESVFGASGHIPVEEEDA